MKVKIDLIEWNRYRSPELWYEAPYSEVRDFDLATEGGRYDFQATYWRSAGQRHGKTHTFDGKRVRVDVAIPKGKPFVMGLQIYQHNNYYTVVLDEKTSQSVWIHTGRGSDRIGQVEGDPIALALGAFGTSFKIEGEDS